MMIYYTLIGNEIVNKTTQDHSEYIIVIVNNATATHYFPVIKPSEVYSMDKKLLI